MSDSISVEAFRNSFTGEVVTAADPNFDETRAVWNGMIDRRPAVIARCADAESVVQAIRFAQEQRLSVSVRGGGHGVAGKAICDGGLVIDLAPMNSVRIDAEARTASVGGGARLADLDAATQAFGLATPAGIVSETGVGGLTLGGGVGYLARRFGLTIDNLLSAEVVTANGERIRADANEHSDLFWALRGGGGNFGVVTSFEFRLHAVGPNVLVGQAFYPITDTIDVLRFYRDFTTDADDELAVYALAVTVPPIEPFAEEYQGKPAIAIVACHSGDEAKGRKALAPLQEFGEPIFRFVEPMPYVALQQSLNAGAPNGQRYYWKSHFMRELSDEAINNFAARVQSLPGPFSIVGFEPMGGAINRVDAGATAFPHRDTRYALGVWSGWVSPDNDDNAIEWTRGVHEAMVPYSTGGVYSNYLDQDDDAKSSEAFADNLARLGRVKAVYDPNNFFQANHNIQPVTGDS